MKHIFIIFVFLTGGAISSLWAQGHWLPFVTNINGDPPLAASFLNEQYGFVQTKKGWERTIDSGKTWIACKNFPFLFPREMQFYFYTSGHIFIESKLFSPTVAFESIDSGITWNTLTAFPTAGIYVQDSLIYVANGSVSSDSAKTWVNIDSSFTVGETIVGNLDNGIAMWDGSGYNEDGGTLYTTNRGKTWLHGQAPIESDFGYAVPHTLTYFAAGGDSLDAIQRTTDGGATWQNVFGPTNMRYLSDGLAGNSCVVFAQEMGTNYNNADGILRSTDLGNTWQHIGGPTTVDDYPMCGATSRGAVCYAMTYYDNDTLWKFIDPTLYKPILNDVQIRVPPNSVTMNDCDTGNLDVQISFSACDFIRLQKIWLEGIDTQFYRVTFEPNKVIAEGAPSIVSIKFLPNVHGIYKFNIHIHIAASDWSGADTTLSTQVWLLINPTTPKLNIAAKGLIDFGIKSFCIAGGHDSVILSNPSCKSVKVDTIRFVPDALSKLDFTCDSLFQFDLMKSTSPVKINLFFNPQSPGVKSGKIIIETDLRNDTIPVFANVLQDARILSCSSDSAHSPVCDSSGMLLHFINYSCHAMSLDSLSISSPFRMFLNQIPTIIQSGDSIILRTEFTPLQHGTASIMAKGFLRYFEPSDTTAFDTTLIITGYGTHGASSYLFSSISATFDTLHLCDSTNQRVVLYSTGCDSLPVGAISISGDSDFHYSVLGTQSSALAVGDSIVLDMSLNPLSIGNKSATITIELQDSTIVTISLNGTVIRPIRLLYSDKSGTLDFGSHLTCENSDTIITLMNPSCDTVRVFDLKLLGSGFVIEDSLPIIIPPGRSKAIIVKTMPDTLGGKLLNSDTLVVRSNADNVISPIELTRTYIYPRPVHLWLDGDRKPFPDTSTWSINIKSLTGDLSGVNQIDFRLDYNTDLLGFLQNRSSVSSTDGRLFHLSSPSVSAIDSTIANIAFEVFLTTDTSTSLSFDDVTLNASDPNFMGCVASPLAKGIDFNYLNVCGDRSIRTFMLGKPIMISIRPNPAQDEIIVDIQSSVKQDATIEIFDALGEKVFESTNSIGGSNDTHIDTRNLSGGVYLLRLHYLSGSVDQSFVKMK